MKKDGEKELIFNEIYSPGFEKKKRLDPSERPIFQLLETLRKSDNDELNSYKYTSKTHPTMSKKTFIPLYDKHIRFPIKKSRMDSYAPMCSLYI